MDNKFVGEFTKMQDVVLADTVEVLEATSAEEFADAKGEDE